MAGRQTVLGAAVEHGATTPTIPDTGALRTDLTQWAAALAAHLNSEDGRKTLRKSEAVGLPTVGSATS